MSRLKVGIMGAGAIGCYLGGRLLAHDVDVLFVGRGRIKSEVEAHGLTLLDMSARELRIPKQRIVIDSEPRALGDCNAILVCVKSGQTSATAELLGGVLGPGAAVVSLQNGLGNADLLRSGLPGRTVLGGVVGFNVICEEGAVFRQATSGPLVIEASAEPVVEELALAFEISGFEVELSRDIRGKQWAKLVINLNNAVSALSGAPSAALLFDPGYRRIVRALISESLGVMRVAGVRPARLGPIPLSWFPRLLGLPTPILRAIAGIQLRIDPHARSSMWEDLTRGRLTEVDYLNGEIVKLAETCSADAPLNRRVVELVHEVERAGKGCPELSPKAFWSALSN